MVAFKSNSTHFISQAKMVPEKLEVKFRIRLEKIVRVAHKSLLDKTPVFEGRTVRNYILTMDSPHQGSQIEPIGSGPPGPTNSMPLGSEPRRPANEAASLATQSALDLRKPFRKVFITNNSEAVAGLERGELPGKGKPSRSPNGMFMITMQEIVTRIQSGAL